MKRSPAKTTRKGAGRSIDEQVESALKWLERRGSKKNREGMARYGIRTNNKIFGVSVAAIRTLAKQLGRNHDLALALWETGCYEARMLAAFVDEPARVTPTQMDRWCKNFDNWAICDSTCFHLFDRTPHAFRKVAQWARHRDEFVRRGAFALLASLALHDKGAGDKLFAGCFSLIEEAANDERNFVKKSVSWALRGIGRRNLALNVRAVTIAKRLAASPQAAARWVGRDAFKELTSPAVKKRLAARGARKS